MTVGRIAFLSLLLLVPAPSLGVAAYMIWLPDTVAGMVLFFLAKGWIVVLPLLVYRFIYRETITVFRFQWTGVPTGIALGAGMSLIVVSSYLWLGEQLIDPAAIQARMREVGLDERVPYAMMAAYWVLLNALLEEYVWRWFALAQALKLMRTLPAVSFAALAFTLHHVVATQLYADWPAVILMGAGVFVGGVAWSWCFVRFGTIWPGYVSHALVDATIFLIGYDVIFLR